MAKTILFFYRITVMSNVVHYQLMGKPFSLNICIKNKLTSFVWKKNWYELLSFQNVRLVFYCILVKLICQKYLVIILVHLVFYRQGLHEFRCCVYCIYVNNHVLFIINCIKQQKSVICFLFFSQMVAQ